MPTSNEHLRVSLDERGQPQIFLFRVARIRHYLLSPFPHRSSHQDSSSPLYQRGATQTHFRDIRPQSYPFMIQNARVFFSSSSFHTLLPILY